MLRLFYCLLFPGRALKKIGNPGGTGRGGRGGSLTLETRAGGGSSGMGNPVRSGVGGQKCLPSVGGVCIFSGITQWSFAA